MAMAEHFRVQAAACRRLDSPMYESLLGRIAEDIDEGGVCSAVLAGHEHDFGPSALALRLAGSVHRLVLRNEAPELARYYPSVGGAWEAAAGWLAFEAVLRTRAEDVWRWLDHPPQTNEVGRAAALMGGLGASATDETPYTHLSLEPTRRTPAARHEFLVVLQLWPTGARTIIGTSVAHGVPTVWE